MRVGRHRGRGDECGYSGIWVRDPQPLGLPGLPRAARGEIPAGQRIIAVLDNLSTHKTREVGDWLLEHPRWQLIFTPKHASWLNQVEIFFSILTRRVLKHGAFTGPEDLATQMLAFVEHYNLTARPFAWTYTGKVLAA